MNQEHQRIKIAEACGWKRRWLNRGGAPLLDAKPKGGSWEVWIPPTPVFSADPDYSPVPPNYLSDLNAMHEAEKVLTGGMRSKYDAELTLICSRDYNFIWESTAAQRAEAFLRTLDLWEE